jgi:hypothetical protein
MWVLDVAAGEGGAAGADTTFYLVAGEWSVGRKRCHFNFQVCLQLGGRLLELLS